MPESNFPARVLILGAGFGGLRAARALRRAPVPVQVTLVDRRNYHLFQPLLYQVATAALSPADIAVPIRSILRKQANAEILMAEVTGIDPYRQRVSLRALEDRSLAYDYLVVATGATHSYFGHDEWSAHAPGLKSIEDATAIRARLLLAFEAAEIEADPAKRTRHLTFVIVGAGPTGVELAGALAEIAHRSLAKDFRHIDPQSARIILIEAAPRILASFPEKLSRLAAQDLTRLGVEIRTGSRVTGIDDSGVHLPGGVIDSQNVIWAAGVKASPAGTWLGVEMDHAGRVKVKPDLSVPGFPNIFVIGDTACALGPDGKPLPGVAPVAMQAGEYVAKAISARLLGAINAPFRYRDKGNLATIGRTSAVADLGPRLRFDGFLGWIAWATVHIFYLINFRNRVLVLTQWAFYYLTYQRSARLITAPEGMTQERERLERRTH